LLVGVIAIFGNDRPGIPVAPFTGQVVAAPRIGADFQRKIKVLMMMANDRQGNVGIIQLQLWFRQRFQLGA